MDTIFIENIEVDTIIGVYEKERIHKQPIILNLEIRYDTSQARHSDNLKYAVDYHKITQDIYTFVRSSSFHLIETLADSVAKKILQYDHVKKVSLSVSKPNALEQAKNVGIKITRTNM